jgi:uncharacterized protein YndB with AHSA1/START domain
MSKEDGPVVVEQTFDASLDEVWSAITEIDQMRQWYFEDIPSFRPEVGFETEFNVHNEGRNFLHMWKVTDVEPLKKIRYTWQYKKYPGSGFVTFELFKQNDRTRLRLTNEGLESFPQDIPEFKRESCIAGWTYFINGRLKDYLARRP